MSLGQKQGACRAALLLGLQGRFGLSSPASGGSPRSLSHGPPPPSKPVVPPALLRLCLSGSLPWLGEVPRSARG